MAGSTSASTSSQVSAVAVQPMFQKPFHNAISEVCIGQDDIALLWLLLHPVLQLSLWSHYVVACGAGTSTWIDSERQVCSKLVAH
jgi:hypothetical protein